MLEEAEIAGQFETLLRLEQEAQQVYARLLAQVRDPRMREQLEQSLKAKQKHIRLIERLLEIVQA